MKVVVAYAPAPRQIRELELVLPDSATVNDAIRTSGLLQEFPHLTDETGDPPAVGVWGRKCDRSQPLSENDRVEIYRSLRVDPKEARRERFSRQGAKGAGLFARTRVGGKAGY